MTIAFTSPAFSRTPLRPRRLGRAVGAWRQRGFALVVTLALMVLLLVLLVGLLGLASVSLRTSTLEKAKHEAEANARLGVLLALGELQKALGPDQRVSARASAVVAEARQPNVLGSWHGWRWQPVLGGRPDYSTKSGQFDRWLVSTPQPDDALAPAYPAQEAKGVWLIHPSATPAVGTASGQAALEMRAGLVPVSSGTASGGVAWAVFDESCKGSMDIEPGVAKDKAGRLAARSAPERMRPDPLAATLSGLKDPRKGFTFESAGLLVGPEGTPELRNRFHDLGVRTLGVLANAADGGLKTDLSTLFESKQTLAATLGEQQPYFAGITTANGIPQWEYLRSHYTKYRKVTGSAAGRSTYTPGTDELKPADPNDKQPGQQLTPASERLLPVVAKLQILFSVVSHYNHLGDRINFFDQYGNPKGNTNYAAPHLVYDPVITLWNPYDVALDLTGIRFRLWDPPVGFQFKKNSDWLRDEFATGEFEGIARFQIQNEGNPEARRYFTMHLRGANNDNTPGARLSLLPGEVKVFSPWVENEWNWAMEIAGGYSPRAFFDWNAGSDFGNIDHRTKNPMGLEAVPGWDARAGLQEDHLSYSSRPDPTRYDFEKEHGWNGGWLCIKLTDTFTVNAKPQRTVPPSAKDKDGKSPPDFQVDMLAAQNTDPSMDILRSFSFRFANVTNEVSAKPKSPVIQRTFRLGDVLQRPEDKTPGGKSPFAIMTMTAKTTVDPADLTKAWLFNNPVVEGGAQDSASLGLAHHSYDLRFEEVQDFNTFPGIEIDGANKRGFFGASATANRGVSAVPMFRVPRLPAASLGDLIPTNLIATSRLPRVNFPFGNSWAHPLIPSNNISQSAGGLLGTYVDHGFMLNDCLWDRFYFSTLCAYGGDLFAAQRTRTAVLEDLFAATSEKPPLNRRLVAAPDSRAPKTRATTLNALDDKSLSKALAAELFFKGPFNVNSDSVDAWRTVLASMRDEAVLGWANKDFQTAGKTAFSRCGVPLAGDADKPGDGASFNVAGQIRWSGFRALTDEQIKLLAESIVLQIRKRGQADQAPFLSAGEFVNRRIGSSSGLHVLRGLLQTAIDETPINNAYHRTSIKPPNDSKAASFAALAKDKSLGTNCQQAMDGLTGEGAPSFLTQGDLLMPLAAVLTVRGDTFKIRAYGESRDLKGQVVASARCEATVQRLPAYLDTIDTAQTTPANLKSQANRLFGRRFVITSFRWLAVDEI